MPRHGSTTQRVLYLCYCTTNGWNAHQERRKTLTVNGHGSPRRASGWHYPLRRSSLQVTDSPNAATWKVNAVPGAMPKSLLFCTLAGACWSQQDLFCRTWKSHSPSRYTTKAVHAAPPFYVQSTRARIFNLPSCLKLVAYCSTRVFLYRGAR